MPIEKLPPHQLAGLDALLSDAPPSAREIGIEITHDSSVTDASHTEAASAGPPKSATPSAHYTEYLTVELREYPGEVMSADGETRHLTIPASRCPEEEVLKRTDREHSTPTFWRRVASWFVE